MARRADREKAIKLRLQGMSYSQIKKELGASKSTLSYWLRDYPLPPERIRELRDWNEKRIENYRETRRRQREEKLLRAYNNIEKKILPITDRDLLVGGLFLYWGEGTKSRLAETSISSTDPAVIKASILWLTKCFGINKPNLKARLHLYSDMDAAKEMRWWSKTLGIPTSQFRKPYIKKTKFKSINYNNPHKHGTCNLIFGSASLGRQIHMGLRVLEDYFNPDTGP